MSNAIGFKLHNLIVKLKFSVLNNYLNYIRFCFVAFDK